ncbi:membrane-anchored protein [Rhizobium sullae]|uniref:membrane-anchored protein n=1 Tax=Rhizobium sullae TaxID=50338 RepID=UPI001FCD4012|nr:membrane-anchored protein [Rhizobium sullae]
MQNDDLENIQHGQVFRAKQWIYRLIKYLLVRPEPVFDPTLIGKIVAVVGSAPQANMPANMDDTYRIVTINGSQHTVESWGVAKPHITIMQYNQIEGLNTNAREVRRILRGRETGTLYLMLWRHGRRQLEQGLRAFDYRCDNLEIIDRYRRVSLVRKVSGVLNFELDASTKYSNGIIAALLALNSNASAVILSGIDPSSAGHAYNHVGLARKHSEPDMNMIRRLIKLGMPIFTADPNVSEATGLPLWQPVPRT